MERIDAFREQLDAAPAAALDHIARSIWQALARRELTEGEAQEAAELVTARRRALSGRTAKPSAPAPQRPRAPRSARRADSIARRRRHYGRSRAAVG